MRKAKFRLLFKTLLWQVGLHDVAVLCLSPKHVNMKYRQ